MSEDLLGIYLNDHLAGSVVGHELVKRTHASNEGTPLGDFLNLLAEEIEEDRRALTDVMDRLGVRRNPAKQAGGWVVEKLGRLKPNGRLLGYSDLSRVLELEGLTIGITGKLALWRNLQALAQVDERLATAPIEEVIRRSERQLRDLQEYRVEAARTAFGD
ncbi:MAG: hypothetical protein GEU78_00240 [Actinobacteria bacterium]|nr:hypothetical protein [Actinomycetota bacterium]